MDRYPTGAAGGVEQSVEQRPVSHGVTAIFHALGFAIRRGDRAAVQMVTPDHDWRLDFAFLDQIIHGQAELRALAMTQPADARRQSLELDSLARQIDPAVEDAV